MLSELKHLPLAENSKRQKIPSLTIKFVVNTSLCCLQQHHILKFLQFLCVLLFLIKFFKHFPLKPFARNTEVTFLDRNFAELLLTFSDIESRSFARCRCFTAASQSFSSGSCTLFLSDSTARCSNHQPLRRCTKSNTGNTDLL